MMNDIWLSPKRLERVTWQEAWQEAYAYQLESTQRMQLWGHIIANEVLDECKLGLFNLHELLFRWPTVNNLLCVSMHAMANLMTASEYPILVRAP